MRFCPFGLGAAIDLPAVSLSKRPARVTTDRRDTRAVETRSAVRCTRLALESREAKAPTQIGVLRVAAGCIGVLPAVSRSKSFLPCKSSVAEGWRVRDQMGTSSTLVQKLETAKATSSTASLVLGQNIVTLGRPNGKYRLPRCVAHVHVIKT
jgi:hypothetical protein